MGHRTLILEVTIVTCRDDVLETFSSLARRQDRRVFSLNEIVKEMKSRGSVFKETTIRTHVSSLMYANAPDHHDIAYDDLVRVNRGRYTLA